MMSLPITGIDSTNDQHAKQIVKIVDILREAPLNKTNLEAQLNEAVFNLYYLTEEEKDLIKDRCSFEISTYYENYKSKAFYSVFGLANLIRGDSLEIVNRNNTLTGMESYIEAFHLTILPLLKSNRKLSHTIIRSKGLDHQESKWTDSIAAIFHIGTIKNRNFDKNEIKSWKDAIRLIEKNSSIKINHAIYVEQFLRFISNDFLFIIKRNERRLWSRTAAREDAMALFAQSQTLPQLQTVTHE